MPVYLVPTRSSKIENSDVEQIRKYVKENTLPHDDDNYEKIFEYYDLSKVLKTIESNNIKLKIFDDINDQSNEYIKNELKCYLTLIFMDQFIGFTNGEMFEECDQKNQVLNDLKQLDNFYIKAGDKIPIFEFKDDDEYELRCIPQILFDGFKSNREFKVKCFNDRVYMIVELE
jgi:hypothetical protein